MKILSKCIYNNIKTKLLIWINIIFSFQKRKAVVFININREIIQKSVQTFHDVPPTTVTPVFSPTLPKTNIWREEKRTPSWNYCCTHKNKAPRHIAMASLHDFARRFGHRPKSYLLSKLPRVSREVDLPTHSPRSWWPCQVRQNTGESSSGIYLKDRQQHRGPGSQLDRTLLSVYLLG